MRTFALRWVPNVQKLRSTPNSSSRNWMIQDAQLREYRGLIPIETLVCYFAGLKLNDARRAILDLSTRGRQAGQHPIHIECVREVDNKFFDDPIVSEDL